MSRIRSLLVSLALGLTAASSVSATPMLFGAAGNGPPDILEIQWDIDYSGTIFDPAPLAQLMGKVSDPDGPGDIVSIQWDFDYDGLVFDPDPSASGTLTPSHAYSTPGTYIVALQVTDSAGNTDLAQILITVPGPGSLLLFTFGIGLLAGLSYRGRR